MKTEQAASSDAGAAPGAAATASSATTSAAPSAPSMPASEPSLPTIDVSAPNEVDKSATSSDVVLDQLDLHFSARIRQVYWQGAVGQEARYLYAFTGRLKDGGMIVLSMPFDPDAAEAERSVDFSKAGQFMTNLRAQGAPEEWIAASGRATLIERDDRVEIDLTSLQLNGPNAAKREITKGSIHGLLERACYAHEPGSFDAADPVADPNWRSDFCKKYQ